MSDQTLSRHRRRQPSFREHQRNVRRKNLVTALCFGAGAALALILILLG